MGRVFCRIPACQTTERKTQMKPFDELVEIFAAIRSHDRMRALFEELFTPKEIETLALRWQLLKDLHAGRPQRWIASRHKISLCKITRGSKVLKNESSIIKQVLDKRTKAKPASRLSPPSGKKKP